jgi:hypothetical protein
MWDIVLLAAAFFACAAVYRFRKPIVGALVRFDQRNASRKVEELRDRHDRFAHYRRTVLAAEESLEEVQSVTIRDERTGAPVKRYRFLGELYPSINEAATARRVRAIEIAREFYAELDGTSEIRNPRPEIRTPALPPK